MNKKELSPLESLKEINATLRLIDSKLTAEVNTVETALLAIQIIAEKRVNVAAFFDLNFDEYNGYCEAVGGCQPLTIPEAAILQQVLFRRY